MISYKSTKKHHKLPWVIFRNTHRQKEVQVGASYIVWSCELSHMHMNMPPGFVISNKHHSWKRSNRRTSQILIHQSSSLIYLLQVRTPRPRHLPLCL